MELNVVAFVIKLSKSPSDIKVAVATDKYGLYGMTENLSKIESMKGNVSLGVIWFLEWATSTVVWFHGRQTQTLAVSTNSGFKRWAKGVVSCC